jgi:hypothetical protein
MHRQGVAIDGNQYWKVVAVGGCLWAAVASLGDVDITLGVIVAAYALGATKENIECTKGHVTAAQYE